MKYLPKAKLSHKQSFVVIRIAHQKRYLKMKFFSTTSFLLLVFLLCFTSMHAQDPRIGKMNAGVTVTDSTLTVSYVMGRDFNTATTNLWNSQRITIKYPDTIEVDWSEFRNLTLFSFTPDPATLNAKDGGDGYYYKVFSSSDAGTSLNLTYGSTLDVFQMKVSATENVTFELTTSIDPWTVSNNLETEINNVTLGNVFSDVVNLGNATFDAAPPTVIIEPLQPDTVITAPITFLVKFSEPVLDFTESDLDIHGGKVVIETTSVPEEYRLVVTPLCPGTLTVSLPSERVSDLSGKLNLASNVASSFYKPLGAPCLATYILQELYDGYYQVSLVSHQDWSGTDAITATAQVTIKVGTSTSEVDSFTIFDFNSLTSGVTWAQNSRYNAPPEDPGYDYISFGLTSYGTNNITYAVGDTVPLFWWKNLGICSEDSIFLMPVQGDPFAYPNSLEANVGQQLSVSGYNEPDVPLCVEGVASCMAEVKFDLKALLQGPFVASEGMMHDSLRVLDLIPKEEPYRDYTPIRGSSFNPFAHYDQGGGEVKSHISSDVDNMPIVDWVLVELRNYRDSSEIISTRSVLVLRDGTFYDPVFGGAVNFQRLRSDKYFITVRHRNHLALMTETAIPLVKGVNSLDFTDPLTPIHGTNAGYDLNGKRLMWAGNSNADDYIMFQGGGIGEGLDIDNVFDNIFTDPDNLNLSYNHVRRGYYPGDNNLDGRVKYQGPANDVDPYIFFNIISRHPDNTQKYINYYINQQLPK
jgi:hypothetical protein